MQQGAHASVMTSRATSSKLLSRHAAGFFAVYKFDLAGNDLIDTAVDFFIPRRINLGLLVAANVLKRDRRDFTLISGESCALFNVCFELRVDGVILPHTVVEQYENRGSSVVHRCAVWFVVHRAVNWGVAACRRVSSVLASVR